MVRSFGCKYIEFGQILPIISLVDHGGIQKDDDGDNRDDDNDYEGLLQFFFFFLSTIF